jgi:hypothetical protein
MVRFWINIKSNSYDLNSQLGWKITFLFFSKNNLRVLQYPFQLWTKVFISINTKDMKLVGLLSSKCWVLKILFQWISPLNWGLVSKILDFHSSFIHLYLSLFFLWLYDTLCLFRVAIHISVKSSINLLMIDLSTY